MMLHDVYGNAVCMSTKKVKRKLDSRNLVAPTAFSRAERTGPTFDPKKREGCDAMTLPRHKTPGSTTTAVSAHERDFRCRTEALACARVVAPA
jgi:hypothetical protein